MGSPGSQGLPGTAGAHAGPVRSGVGASRGLQRARGGKAGVWRASFSSPADLGIGIWGGNFAQPEASVPWQSFLLQAFLYSFIYLEEGNRSVMSHRLWRMDNLSDSADAAAAGTAVTVFCFPFFFLKKKKINQLLFSADLQVALLGDGNRRWRT